ncbi:MAG: PDZ domain-containing protein [Legionellales bacterium]|jgi:Do/DeqQ family serine protease|nr:PDZ domain-containing protein [Legionellales bacterium]
MKKYKIILSAAVILFSSITQAGEKAPVNSLNPMLTKVMPTVVNIRSQHDPKFGQDPYSNDDKEQNKKGSLVELGSGVIIDAKHGLIVTNAHVVHDASTILITLNDSRKYLANTVGEDAISDIAILHISAKNLSEIEIGRSKDLKVGDYVTAIGNPFGLHQTVTSGIVSGLHRNANNSLNNFIQTDAPINPGNSGGALINLSGELVGINTAILSTGNAGNIGIGFAIPSDMMTNIIKQIIQYKDVKRGMLGVTMQELTPQLAKALKVHTKHGAIINSVTPGSAAEKAELKPKDIIVSIDDQDIYTADEAKSYIGVLREGSKVAFSIERDNLMQQKYATLGSIKETLKKSDESILSGMTLIDYDEIDNSNKRTKGVIVTSVHQGSKVWLGGLGRGDVITSLNNKKISNLDEFTKEINIVGKQSDKEILLDVKRGMSSYLIVVE